MARRRRASSMPRNNGALTGVVVQIEKAVTDNATGNIAGFGIGLRNGSDVGNVAIPDNHRA